MPTSDPDARVLPGKRGGYAPAYTTVLATDESHGFIVDAQVIVGNDEASTVLPGIERIEESFGRKPKEITADSGFNTGPNLAALAELQVEALMPPRQEPDASAALRPDPAKPVAEADRARLPVNPQNKVLDRAAFLYDAGEATIAARWAGCWSGRRTGRTTGTGKRGRIRCTRASIAAAARWRADACAAVRRPGGSAGTSTKRCVRRWPSD